MSYDLSKCSCGEDKMVYETGLTICKGCGKQMKLSDTSKNDILKRRPELLVETTHEKRFVKRQKRNKIRPHSGQKSFMFQESLSVQEEG